MRRFLTLVCLLCVAIPAGISISGCTRNPAGNYCNGLGYGLTDTQVASIFLSPQTTGMSIAFGQTQQVAAPTAKTCKGTAATVTSYTYGTTNNQLVDISPTGNICAGTWNRNTGGGIPNYTICNFPSPLPSTTGLPYGVAYVTASGSSVTSNPVAVYVHPQVTSLTLVGPTTCLSQGVTATNPLDVQACFVGSGTTPTQQLLCAPPSITSAAAANPALLACPVPTGGSLGSIPDCTAAIGTLGYTVSNGTVATINQDTNQITAELPGTTVITASVAQGASSAGYFSTCPPASINVTLANGTTSGTITQGVAQNLTTTVYDTMGAEITGLTLSYQSTDPFDISVGTTGSINTNFPGVASVTAICEPPACNPAPNNVTGLNGTGLSISSDPVKITTPGTASDYVWFSSPGQSQYFVPVELLTNTVGSTVRLPYVPNSMLMDKIGASIYFGSARELMVYSTTTNTLSSQATAVPGVVLAVAPNNAQILVNDQARQLFYLYTPASGASTTFGGMGAAAEWTPDSQTLYIFDNAELNSPTYAPGTAPQNCPSTPLITGHTDTLYVYNVNSGWTYYPLPASPLPAAAIPTCTTEPNTAPPLPIQTPAITNPGVGAFLAGNPTVAHTWCPETVAPTSAYPAGIEYYPLGDSVSTLTDVLAATTDGEHILGAALNGTVSISDIGITLPMVTTPSGAVVPAACTSTTTGTPPNQVVTLQPLNITGTFTATVPVTVTATTVNQMVPSPNSALAFLTYSDDAAPATTGAMLPYYLTSTPGTNGTVGYVTLTGAAQITAPQVGTFSPDGTLFFVGTAGDNLVHYISIPTTITSTALPTDSQQVAPGLPACIPVLSGGTDAGCTLPTIYTDTVVPVTAIVVKPRSTT